MELEALGLSLLTSIKHLFEKSANEKNGIIDFLS